MAISSIPAAIDYLIATVRLLPECAPPVTVHDGFPAGTGNPAVAIGVVPNEDGVTASEAVHAQLGAQAEYETFNIPVVISSWVGGGEEAMKPARDAAFTIFNAINTAVRADRTLSGVLHGGAALLTSVRVDQTTTAEQGGEGRSCAIAFLVQCKNRF